MKVSNLQNGIAMVVALSGGVLVIDRISEDGVRVVNVETGGQLVVVLHNDELLFKGENVEPSETYITHPAIRGVTNEEEDCDCDCDDEEDDEDYDDEDDCDDDYDDEDEDDYYDEEDDEDEEDEDDELTELIGFAICIIGQTE